MYVTSVLRTYGYSTLLRTILAKNTYFSLYVRFPSFPGTGLSGRDGKPEVGNSLPVGNPDFGKNLYRPYCLGKAPAKSLPRGIFVLESSCLPPNPCHVEEFIMSPAKSTCPLYSTWKNSLPIRSQRWKESASPCLSINRFSKK